MIEERRLSKTEASLGLTLIAALLLGLGWAYVYQLDEPAPLTPADPHWAAAKPAAVTSTAIEQTAYRPEWLSPQGDEPPATFLR
jgi:hypothetical protein